jgi:hemerythrin
MPLELVNYLKDWLFDHILGADMKYVEHFEERGIR